MRLALALALAACDPGAVPDTAPESCALPAVGDTCPHRVDDAEAAAELLDRLVHCGAGEVVDGSGPAGGVVERGCRGPGYRYPAGGWIEGWGLTYQTPGRALVRCNPEARVAEVWHLAQCDDGRRGLVLDEAWAAAVDLGRCWTISENCGGDP